MTVKNIISVLFLLSILTVCNSCNRDFECESGEKCIEKKCYDRCELIKCIENAECVNNGYQADCFCKPGFEGNTTVGCKKLNKDPCEPNPCGPNSICQQGLFGKEYDKKIGTFCICEENFFGKPPNCGAGCDTSNDCKSNEICDSTHTCVNYCEKSVCGTNSNCRNDNHINPRCSCQDGYYPESGKGCRLKSQNDSQIPIKNIQEQLNVSCEDCEPCTDRCYKENEICVNGRCIKSPCSAFCDELSNCEVTNGTLECFNAFSSKDNPFLPYAPEFSIQSIDDCRHKATKPECGVSISEAAIKTLVFG